MKKLICFVLTFSIVTVCSPKFEKSEKIMEDGVEVIVNQKEPYKIEGKANLLHLEKEFSIDTEKDEVISTGLLDIQHFDVDDEGNLYFSSLKNSENCIFKFDSEGNFLLSFGRKGQGPGEFQFPGMVSAQKAEISVTDLTKVVFFDREGQLLREIPKDSLKVFVIPMSNNKFLVRERIMDRTDQRSQYSALIIYDPAFNIIKEIIRVTLQNPLKGQGFRAIVPMYFFSISGDKIYEGNTERGYEICVYNSNGNLLKKIRKNYDPVVITEENKKNLLKQYKSLPEEIKKTIHFPENFPPFQYFFSDDEGRLFVMTYEEGQKPRYFLYDIFNTEGIFVGRIELDNCSQLDDQTYPLPAVAQKNLLYCLCEKNSGYKELVVYRMIWK